MHWLRQIHNIATRFAWLCWTWLLRIKFASLNDQARAAACTSSRTDSTMLAAASCSGSWEACSQAKWQTGAESSSAFPYISPKCQQSAQLRPVWDMNHCYDALLQYLCAEKIRCGKLRALLLQPEQSLDRRQLHLLAVDRSPSHLRSHQFLHAIAHLPIFSNSPSSQFIQTLTVTQYPIHPTARLKEVCKPFQPSSPLDLTPKHFHLGSWPCCHAL